MTRLSAALVAVATTCSLSVAAATAAERTSSDVSTAEATAYGSSASANDNLTSSAKKFKEEKLNSSGKDYTGAPNIAEYAAVISSLKNDVAKGYPAGTTAEILVGSGIAALVLTVGGLLAHAINTGLIKIPGR